MLSRGEENRGAGDSGREKRRGRVKLRRAAGRRRMRRRGEQIKQRGQVLQFFSI